MLEKFVNRLKKTFSYITLEDLLVIAILLLGLAFAIYATVGCTFKPNDDFVLYQEIVTEDSQSD